MSGSASGRKANLGPGFLFFNGNCTAIPPYAEKYSRQGGKLLIVEFVNW
jgi:hypothetical protein